MTDPAKRLKRKIRLLKSRIIRLRLQFQKLRALKQQLNRKHHELRKCRFELTVQNQVYFAVRQSSIESYEKDIEELAKLKERLENIENENPDKND